MKKTSVYYVIAFVVICIWSTTYVATKVLLEDLSPIQIMFYRYIIAYTILWLAYPKMHKMNSFKEELLFIGAGFFGGTLYFLTENYALQYTLASNVGLLIASAPLLTAFAAHFLTQNEKFHKNLAFGAIVALIGVSLVIFNGKFILRLNPIGDFLAIGSAASWAIYAVLIKKIGNTYKGIYVTRKVFFYSILTMLPCLGIERNTWDFALLLHPKIFMNLLFLGILASSICFLLWSKVIWEIGVVKANNFIYLVPLITMIFAVAILGEKATPFAIMGGVLIVAGVYISENGIGIMQRGKNAKNSISITNEESTLTN